jgi:hypothetical protein
MTVLAGGAALAAVAVLCALRPGWIARVPAAPGARAAAGAAAVALVAGGTEPTGWIVLDAVATAAVAAAVVLTVAARGQGWLLWLCAATAVALVLADAGDWEPVGAAGIGIALALVLSGVRQPALDAVATAAVIAPLAHLSWPVATGASGALVAVAFVPVLLAGIGVAPPRLRRALPWAVAAVILVGIGGSVAGGLSALGARTDVDRAVDAAIAGLDQVDADDTTEAVAKLREAAAAFDAAETELRALWARPALLVPGVAQQSRAVATMADSGAELARAAATSLEEVDLDTLHPVAGRIDPTLIETVEPPLRRALESLRSADDRLADVDSPLLLGPVADRLDELAEKVQDARDTAETASAALAVAPDLLGADGPRRYFLVAHTPSEARGVGGFMGSWGELVLDDGRFDLVRTGRLRELTQGGPDPAGRRIEGEADFVRHWGQAPAQFWGLIGFTPDFPTLGRIIAQLYPQSGGSELDGVIAIDPAGFAAMLELTGPITVPGYEGVLAPETAEQILLHDQYLGLEGGLDDDREAFLEAAIRTLFDQLTSGELPGPRTISAELAPMVDGRHIQLFSTHDAEQRFFTSIDADGSVARRRADGIGVVNQNNNGNKIDYFLRRTLTYDVVWDPDTGAVDGAIEVRLENLAPAAGLPHAVIGWGGDLSANQLPVADGENLTYVSLYTAATLDDLAVDGQPAELNRLVADLGYQARDVYVRIPPGGTKVLTATVDGQVEPGRRYQLEVLRQATATPDQVRIRVRLPDGWRFESARGMDVDRTTASWTSDSSGPIDLDLRVEPVERTLLERLQGR